MITGWKIILGARTKALEAAAAVKGVAIFPQLSAECRTRDAKAQGTGCHHNHDKRAGSFGKLNRYLPLDEACRQDGLHELCRHELGFLRDRFLAQFEDLADRVLPDPALIKNKVARL